MLVKTFGNAVYGVEAITITVEVSVNNKGKDYFIVGLSDSAVKESLQRVESAIKSNHYYIPPTKGENICKRWRRILLKINLLRNN